jgi:hypothetical protein
MMRAAQLLMPGFGGSGDQVGLTGRLIESLRPDLAPNAVQP